MNNIYKNFNTKDNYCNAKLILPLRIYSALGHATEVVETCEYDTLPCKSS